MEEVYTDYIYHCEEEEEIEYHNVLFQAASLVISSQVKFVKCKFPNLRHIRFEKMLSEHLLFEECDIPHKLNLHFTVDTTCDLGNAQVISIFTEDVRVEIKTKDGVMTPNRSTFQAEKFILKKKIRCGDSIDEFLEEFKEAFADDSVCFSDEIFEEQRGAVVLLHGVEIGEIIYEVDDYPFSKAVFFCDGHFLAFDGVIPTKWSSEVSPAVLERFGQLRSLSVKSIKKHGLSNLVIDLDQLVVEESIEGFAFSGSLGEIKELEVGTITNWSFPEGIRLRSARVNDLRAGADLIAQTITIPDSMMVDGIKSTETLIITKKYSGTITVDAIEVNTETADGSGIFIVKFPTIDATMTGPGVCYGAITLTLEIPRGKQVDDIILRELREKFHRIDKVDRTIQHIQDHTLIWVKGNLLADCLITYEKESFFLTHLDLLVSIFILVISALYVFY